MKNLISSALLTAVAVPFLMAAPAPKKAQAPAQAADQQTAPAKTKKSKKHVKKVQKETPAASANNSAPAK